VNTFRGKYGAVPGDMNVATANQFGFTVGGGCSGIQGARDGNGLIDGYSAPYVLYQGLGETELFWQDLPEANLIDGTFPNGSAPAIVCNSAAAAQTISASGIGGYLPAAKIGNGNFVYVYEENGVNWWGLSAITGFGNLINCNTTIPVSAAFSIDEKIDDGLPTTGTVQAIYIPASLTSTSPAPYAVSDSPATCYNTNGPAYSIAYNNGSGVNCALSFRFQ
jgi:hypothetical protein